MSNSVPNNVNVYQDTPNRVLVDEQAANIVVVRTQALGYAPTKRFIYTQTSPSATWVINHNLGGKPSITVVDSAGTVVTGEVSYNADTEITIYFTVPFSGSAYLT